MARLDTKRVVVKLSQLVLLLKRSRLPLMDKSSGESCGEDWSDSREPPLDGIVNG
jgi:hypothetical protein